jgi:CDGSH iron-sulfur domain-containing protein 3
MATPDCPKKGPYVQMTEAGTHYWCACGKSKDQPMCDGSHGGTEFSPVAVEVTEAKNIAWCGCKQSANGAFCDGTHTKL